MVSHLSTPGDLRTYFICYGKNMKGLAMRLRMPRRIGLTAVLAIVGCCGFPVSARAATAVTSNIATDTHWTLSESPYVVEMPRTYNGVTLFSVLAGASLHIDPGVVVKFGKENGMLVYGALVAEGTADSPIFFTSTEDDSVGGLTSGEASSTPTDGQWMHVEFEPGSSGTVSYATVRYGGGYITPVPRTGIANAGGVLMLSHMTFTHNAYDGFGQWSGTTTLSDSQVSNHEVGITVAGGMLTLHNTHIFNNTDDGIYMRGGSLLVAHSEIDHNATGMYSEGHDSVVVHDSSIHDNTDLGVLNDASTAIDARDDWWGSASGPHDTLANVAGSGNGIEGAVTYTPWLTVDPSVPDPCAVPGACTDNVLFLPGIEGSRLYEGTACGGTAEEKLWEPYSGFWGVVFGAGDSKVAKLALTTSGKSECSDIYAKDGDIIDSAGGAIYQPVIDQMQSLKAAGTINDWSPAAYDWRLSLNDLLTRGAETNGNINYATATDTPYIEQMLRRLAASSKTGKVTIIAHSNGGLVAKALLARLGNQAATLVDRVIMVAVPQTGAPAAVGSLLLGYNAGIYDYGIGVVSNAAARALAQNSPMAYHLLPSVDYFTSIITEPTHPVVHFSGPAYAAEEAAYGNSIIDRDTFDNFLLGTLASRADPEASDLKDPEIANSALVQYANTIHNTLDRWVPPTGIEVDQIAGWGIDTVAGIDFYTMYGTKSAAGPAVAFEEQPRSYIPIFTEDGDGTVPVPSALAMASSTNVKRFWVDLHSINKAQKSKISHANIFGVTQLGDLIASLLGSTQNALPFGISTSSPTPLTQDKKLIFILHSPLTLQLSNAEGETTGLSASSTVTENIPGAQYGQFGEVQYLIAPAGSQYQLNLSGLASGMFSLDIEESLGGTLVATATIADVPVSTSTTVHLTISNGIADASALSVDENGDGSADFAIKPSVGTTTQFTEAVSATDYISYMEKAVVTLSLSKNMQRQLDTQLKGINRNLALIDTMSTRDSALKGLRKKISVGIEKILARTIVFQIEALEKYLSITSKMPSRWQARAPQNTVSPQEAQEITAMLEELKLLVTQNYEH